MSEADRASRRARLPLAFIATIGLIVAIEACLDHFGREALLLHEAWGWRQSAVMSRTIDPAGRVLCFGDSQLKWGIAPLVVQKITGRTTDNLSMSGAPAAASFFLLRRTLQSGKRPDAILVDFIPSLLAAEPSQGAPLLPEIIGIDDAVDLAVTTRNPGLVARTVVPWLLPSVRNRLAIRMRIVDLVRRTKRLAHSRIPPSVRRNLAVNRGGLLMPGKPLRPEDFGKSLAFFPPEWACHRISESYVGRFLELAGKHDVPVFWLLPPLPPTLQAECDRSGFSERYSQFAQRFQRRYKGLTLIDGRRGDLSPSQFTDWIHLGRDGSIEFSAEVATIVASKLSGDEVPPWVELTLRGGVRFEEPLEDLEKSRLALRIGKPKRQR